MGRLVKWLIGIAASLVGLVVVLLVAGFAMLNTKWLQQKLLSQATQMLTDKLQTKVEIDSVSIDLLTLDAHLFGLLVEDRQQRPMLQMEQLKADVDIMALLNNEVVVPEIKVQGVRAELHKVPKDSLSPDTVANFQFIIDTFKKDKKPKAPRQPQASKGKKKLQLTLNEVSLERIKLMFNGDSVDLGALRYTQQKGSSPEARLTNLHATWERVNKKGENVTNQATIGRIDIAEQVGHYTALLRDLSFKTDNHRPRKNTGKPNRGFFDVGHFDIRANMKLTIDSIEGGTVHGYLRECTARDTVSGIDIRKLQCEVEANKNGMVLNNVEIHQGETQLKIEMAEMQFPNKKTGRKLSYRTSTIRGKAILRSISRPFAPVLRNFTLPLTLSVRMEGNDEGMRFHDVVVARPNGALKINAQGYITGLKNKFDLKVHFDVSNMTVKQGEPERIINQFVVKKFMMKQLNRLGNIHYRGSFNVLYKKEEFQGHLGTKSGGLDFFLTLDEKNKYLTGTAHAKDIRIGDIMDMKDIGPVTAKADFKFDYSKPRTALMRKKYGGKLPIGQVKALVSEASYKFVKAKNVSVELVSNGAIAEGSVMAPGSFADLSCTFSFTNTNEMKKMKVKPKVHFNLFRKKTDAEKAAKAEEKAARKAAKEAEKAAKAKEKAARKAAKEKEEAAEAEEKAARKAAKKAEKEARKAAKKAEKEARKAAKEAEKAARKAAE